MDLDDADRRARFLIRDRDGKFPSLLDVILTDAGIRVVLSGVQMPRMNSIMERWVQTCRHELLDRTLIWNQRHLLHALRHYEKFYNSHRPHQGIANARPLQPLPTPSPIRPRSPVSTSTNANGWVASSTNTTMPPDLHGRHFRQTHRYWSWNTRFPPPPK
jgi:transposase InsO family protein